MDCVLLKIVDMVIKMDGVDENIMDIIDDSECPMCGNDVDHVLGKIKEAI